MILPQEEYLTKTMQINLDSNNNISILGGWNQMLQFKLFLLNHRQLLPGQFTMCK